MKIYLVCPQSKTGGPENIHQLCNYFNELGEEAYIYYNPPAPASLYPEFPHIKTTSGIEDSPENLLIIPEILDVSEIRKTAKNIRVAIWWLSYTNACLFGTLHANLTEPDTIHLFHSYYEYAMVRPFLSFTTRWFFVTEHIHDDFLSLQPDKFQEKKEKLVCFHGNKDRITYGICTILNLPTVNLTNLSREEVLYHLQRARLYVDMGFHPGKDHLPREASMCGCIVVTNQCGSAAYHEDVPIDEKVTFEKELLELIPKILEDPKSYYENQATYREFIQSEKETFKENARFFLGQLKKMSDATEPDAK